MANDIINDQSSAQARGERVRRLRNMANLSRQDMCKNGDFKIDTLIGWEVARHGGLSEKGAQKVLERVALEGVICSPEWLLQGMGNGPTIVCNIDINNNQEDLCNDEYNILEELSLFKKHYSQAIDYLITDDAMSPVYNSGDRVAGIICPQDKLNKIIGQDCIIKLEDGTLIVRRVYKGQYLNCYTLIPIHFQCLQESVILANEKLIFAAPIIWYRRKIDFRY